MSKNINPMSVHQLHAILEGLIKHGWGRVPVCVDVSTFGRAGDILHEVHSGKSNSYEIQDGDGFPETDAKGRVKEKVFFVLRGKEEAL